MPSRRHKKITNQWSVSCLEKDENISKHLFPVKEIISLGKVSQTKGMLQFLFKRYKIYCCSRRFQRTFFHCLLPPIIVTLQAHTH